MSGTNADTSCLGDESLSEGTCGAGRKRRAWPQLRAAGAAHAAGAEAGRRVRPQPVKEQPEAAHLAAPLAWGSQPLPAP